MAITVQVKPRKTTVSSVTVGGTPNIELSQLNNVEIVQPANNEVLIYEAGSNRWLNKPIEKIDINGGSF